MDKEKTFYKELHGLAIEQQNKLISYLKLQGQEDNGYIKFIRSDDERVEFKIGLEHFVTVLKISVKSSANEYPYYHFRLYEIIDNVNDYGKYMLMAKSELSVKGDFDQNIEFVEEQPPTKLDFGREINNTIIRSFPEDYIRQIVRRINS